MMKRNGSVSRTVTMPAAIVRSGRPERPDALR